jgi:hypothetical protein
MRTSLLLALLLALPLSAAAQADQQEPPPAACAAILAKPFDGGLDPRVQPDCDSTAYYFGIGRDKDYAAARACAFIERFHHVDKDGSIFTGPGILSMIYANGEGTPRDLDLARRFVCENKEAAPSEIETRLQLLDKIATALQPPPPPQPGQFPPPPRPQPPAHFSLCATSSTGTSWGWCTTLQVRINDAKRYDDMVKIVDGLTPQGVEAFKTLQTAEATFETVRSDKEVDQTGAARAAWVLQEQDRVRAQFVSDLKLFSTPTFSEPATLAAVEALVDKDYASLRVNGATIFRGTTITVAGVDQTQIAWRKYREAWRAYEGVVNPTVSSDDVATQLGRERLTQLHKLLNP